MAIEDRLFTLLAHDGSGLAIGLGVCAIGLAVATSHPSGFALVALGALLAAGGLRHRTMVSQAWRDHPPPGRFVEVAGQRMHLLAEGPTGSGATIVWIAGGHVGAHAMAHLHAAFRGEVRSILLDRFGTGWSDTGPFPRTTAREADETIAALEAAGERGPFVFAGHSFGGLLAANIARRRPDLTQAVALIDATPLDVVAYGPRLAALQAMRTDALKAGLCGLFGIDLRAGAERKSRANPAYARVLDAVEREVGASGKSTRAIESVSSGCWFASASIYRELVPTGLMDRAWETMVFDGDLGDLPVYVIAPQDAAEVAALPEAVAAGATEAQRIVRFFAHARERYRATSTRSVRIVAPAGSGHNFPYETPAFLIDVLHDVVRDVMRRP